MKWYTAIGCKMEDDEGRLLVKIGGQEKVLTEMEEVEMKVTHLVKNMMDTNWDQLLLKYQHQRSSLVPNINRIQVEETSKRFLEAGIKPEELFYSPSFTFEKAQMEYTDVMFLYTLNHAKKAVKMIADKWLSESFWEISQKRIYIGCVREEMKELQKGAA